MKINIDKSELIKGITIVQKAVRNDSPILNCILLSAENNALKLSGSNDIISITTKIPCTISAEDETAVNSRLFGDIIKKLPDNDIKIDMKNGKLKITSGKSKFELSCVDSKAFPKSPDIKEISRITLNHKILKHMINATAHCIGDSSCKPIFTGAYLAVNNKSVDMVCIDGFRMAIKTEILEQSQSGSVIIPGKTIKDIYSLLNESHEPVEIILGNNQAAIVLGDTKITTSIITGDYLNYKNIVPVDYETIIKVNKHDLYHAVDRITIMSDHNMKLPCVFTINGNELTISADTTIGTATDTLQIESNNENSMTLGFNPRYFLDALKAIPDEWIDLKLSSEVGPSIIQGDDYTHMILPVRISNQEF